jgi:hypothetical protein
MIPLDRLTVPPSALTTPGSRRYWCARAPTMDNSLTIDKFVTPIHPEGQDALVVALLDSPAS